MVEGALVADGWPRELEVGVAGLALEGEVRSGDLAVFAPYDRGGLGLGLPGARRLVDEFDVQSAPGEGTTVTLVKWTRSV